MLDENHKILVHFNTDYFSAYTLNKGILKEQCKKRIVYGTCFVDDVLLKEIDQFMIELDGLVENINKDSVKLYATGIFQKFPLLEQAHLIIEIYVKYGLYFNIINPDLEQFYSQNSRAIDGSKNIIKGLVFQEFRKVVVCGSFQQHLKEIDDVLNHLRSHNVEVLSPWTTEIVQETSGTNFMLLKGQSPLRNERDAWKHKYIHMHKFIESDAIIICNPGGLVGLGTMFEFGFMVANFKRIIFTEKPKNLSILFPYEVGLNF